MTSELPAPLTPPDCDLTDFGFMPLDVVRLRDSKIVDDITGDEFRAAVLLWCASWHQVPAGSLPDDDQQLSKYSGYGRVVKSWKKVREGALHGFVKCSDGRLYHPTVCEKAREAWEMKRKASVKGKAGASKRWGSNDALASKQNGTGNATAMKSDSTGNATAIANDATGNATSMGKHGEPDSTGTKKAAEFIARDRTGHRPDRTRPDQPEANRKQPSTTSAREAANELCEELNIRLENDPERLNWPGKIGQWLDHGGVLNDLLAAGRRSRARGDPPKNLGFYLKMSEDEKAKREVEEGAHGDVKSPTKDYWLTHGEIRKCRRDALAMYASDGRWVPNELPNGAWGDAFDTGPPPHDPRTKITDELLDSVPGARARRDKILAGEKAPA